MIKIADIGTTAFAGRGFLHCRSDGAILLPGVITTAPASETIPLGLDQRRSS
jgi:hypothetical protein